MVDVLQRPRGSLRATECPSKAFVDDLLATMKVGCAAKASGGPINNARKAFVDAFPWYGGPHVDPIDFGGDLVFGVGGGHHARKETS